MGEHEEAHRRHNIAVMALEGSIEFPADMRPLKYFPIHANHEVIDYGSGRLLHEIVADLEVVAAATYGGVYHASAIAGHLPSPR